MSIPLGKVIEDGRGIKEITIKLKLKNLKLRSVTGHINITIKAESIQDGTLIIEKGRIVGAMYDYLKFGRTFFGKNALILALNALASPVGVVDIYELAENEFSVLKAELKEAFLKGPIDLTDDTINQLVPEKFRPDYEQQVKATLGSEKRDALLSRFGLRELEREEERAVAGKFSGEVPEEEEAEEKEEEAAPPAEAPSAEEAPAEEEKGGEVKEEAEAPPEELPKEGEEEEKPEEESEK